MRENAFPVAEGKPSKGAFAKAALIGFIAGAFFFLVLQPFLLGWRPKPILEREGFLGLLLFSLPLVVVPFVSAAVALFKPPSRPTAFKFAICMSGMFLIPIPLVDYWLTAPSGLTRGAFSRPILIDITVGFTYLGGLAFIPSFVSAFISPFLYKFIHKRLLRKPEVP